MKLEIFNNETFGAVRVLADEKNDVWFALVDVCNALGIKNPRDVKAKQLKKDGVDTIYATDKLGRPTNITIINEANLYRLIFQSRKEEAIKFQDWVVEEVIPAIRKHGMYMTNDVIETIHKDPKQFLKMVNDYVAAIEKLNLLTHTKKTYTTTEIAKELGFRSARELNKKLEEMKIQYKSGGTWVLNAEYSTLGYIETKQGFKVNGQPVYYPRWTQKGREFLFELFKNNKDKAS